MNMQEGVPVNVPSPTPNPCSPAPPQSNIQRIMPVLYVNQSNVKSVASASPSPSPGVPASSSAPTILTAMPQIQLASGGNHPQIIHSTPNPNTYSYVPVRQVYQQAKSVKDTQKKVFVTSINQQHNNKSNQVNLIIPNSQNANTTNQPKIFPTQTSLILPQIGTVSNKGTITGMLVPNNPATQNTNKQAVASLLLPANSKYPNIAPNKKVPIPNILIPQPNISAKPAGVPNIIRQTNAPAGKNVVGILSPSPNTANQQMTSLLLTPNNNANNKQPPTSVGLILPTSGGSHGLIVPQSTAGQSHGIIMTQAGGGQSHGIIMPQPASNQSHSIIMPQSTVGQSQVTNLIFTSATTNTPVTNLLLSQPSGGSTHMTSLLIPQSSGGSSPAASLTSANGPNAKTSIIVPVSVGPNKTGLLQPITYTNGKKSADKSLSLRENKQSVLMKTGSSPEGTYSNLPPLQPISKEGINRLTSPHKPANGYQMNVPESLIMTPISDNESIKCKLTEKISDEMTIERTVPINIDDKGCAGLNIKLDEMSIKMDEDYNRADMTTMTTMTPLRNSDQEEGVVLDGEVTVRRLALNKEDVPEKKQIEDDVKIELIKPERQKPPPPTLPLHLPPPRYQKPEDLDPMEVLEWDCQGVGKLPGSNIKWNFQEGHARNILFWEQPNRSIGLLDMITNPYSSSPFQVEITPFSQFRINEYGLDLVVDKSKDDPSSKSNTPNSSRRNSDDKPQENNQTPRVESKDQIYCCEGCGCYGLYTEFLTDTRFCSIGCKKIVLARNDLKRKKQEDKLKELRLRRKRRKLKIMAQRARRDNTEQKDIEKDDEKKAESTEVAEIMAKTWSNKMAELRKGRKSSEGGIKITPQTSDLDDSRVVSPASDSEMSENISRSSPQTNPSDDDISSDRTAPSDMGNVTSWLNNSGEFMWSMYLQKCCKKAKAAPVKLFKDPFPYGKNGFKVGMKLEGIDPEHQAIISVLTVGQTKGHRIRLHFDGYPDHHDFWVNSDSPDIFPPGWCERNNHTLHPPRGYSANDFNWNTYLKQCRATPAPKSLFPKSNTPLCPSQFRVGMKLEAVDRKNSSLICVASVADLIDNRLLIHFDSWGDVYDYWTDPSSPYIHPVGWCEENGHDLTPPNNFKNPSTFSWDAYLKETKSQAAPARAFKPRSPNMFKREMKLEAIDKRAPSHLRPATVKEVMEYQIKITFDGYPDEFGYWVDDDCPEIHPTGWGHKTGHPVTPPPIPSQYVKNECGTAGCTGDGSVKGGFLVRHVTTSTCPYSPQNLNKETIPDRFCINPDFYEVPEPINKSKSTSIKQEASEDSTSSESRVKTRNSLMKEENKEEPAPKVEQEEKTEERVERRGRKRKVPDPEQRVDQLDRLRKELITSVIDPGYKPNPADQEMWVKHVTTLSHKVNVTGGDPRMWNHKQVAAFVNTVIPSRAKLFLDQEIDGESFLMLTQNDLTKVLGLKLGPALKIYNCIILLRQKVMTL